MNTFTKKYLDSLNGQEPNTGALAFLASLDEVSKVSPEVVNSIVQELKDQRSYLKLIASENYSSLPTQFAMANLLTDKYTEGCPGRRFYAGCENVDDIEALGCKYACELFGADHAYIQPHSGADANLVAFLAILKFKLEIPELKKLDEKNPINLSRENWQKLREIFRTQKLVALDMMSGGHLTHGYRHNISSQMFDTYHYGVHPETNLIDLEEVRKICHDVKPLILLGGYSAHSRKLNFAKMREIADEVGAVFMVDMAHFAGLVAGGVFEGDFDPVKNAHIVTSTTHKTLRGPRGGIILCKEEFAEFVDKGCPMVLGGPLPHVMAAKTIAFKEALDPSFKTYAKNIVENADALAQELITLGVEILTGGTENHLMLINVSKSFGLTGRQAENALRECGITLNRNSLPNDANGAWYTSGLRLGTPAVTTLGMRKDEMKKIATLIHQVLSNLKPLDKKAKYELDPSVRDSTKLEVKKLLDQFKLYPELPDLD